MTMVHEAKAIIVLRDYFGFSGDVGVHGLGQYCRVEELRLHASDGMDERLELRDPDPVRCWLVPRSSVLVALVARRKLLTRAKSRRRSIVRHSLARSAPTPLIPDKDVEAVLGISILGNGPIIWLRGS